jgi:hypothetical protein
MQEEITKEYNMINIAYQIKEDYYISITLENKELMTNSNHSFLEHDR